MKTLTFKTANKYDNKSEVITVSYKEFIRNWEDDIQYVENKLQNEGIFQYSLNEDGNVISLKYNDQIIISSPDGDGYELNDAFYDAILENWNFYSAKVTSPSGVRPKAELIKID